MNVGEKDNIGILLLFFLFVNLIILESIFFIEFLVNEFNKLNDLFCSLINSI